MFLTYRPFTLEGNMCACDALQEMLLQDHFESMIISPAVPDNFKNYSFKLRSKKGVIVEVVVKNGETIVKRGQYNSAITVNDGAHVVAVFDNEVGSVETLRFLFVSDGSLGNYDSAAQTVRLLALTGIVYENNATFVEYLVFNYNTGVIETRLTSVVGLTVGEVYVIGSDGTIVNVNGSVNSGVVNGFTASTVTIGDDTFHITADTKIATIDVNLTLKNQTIEDALEKTVDFVVDGDNVTLILIK